MMSFCKKSVHSLLAFSNPLLYIDTNSHEKLPPPSKSPPAASHSGLGLIAGETVKTPNVLESATVRSFSSPAPPSSSLVSLLSPPSLSIYPAQGKKDPGGIGFIDDIGGGVNGLMSCTESLGFESCDERRVDDGIELCSGGARSMSKVKWRKVGERREAKKFPPPLSSFNHNGQPSFFLRPVRKDGRLELTEVRIDRPEILRASREDGRLRLHLIRDEEEEQQEQDNLDIIEEEKEEMEEGQENDDEVEEETIFGEKKFLGEEGDQEEITGEWRVSTPAVSTSESLRRCHDDAVMVAVAVAHAHHHHNRNYHHHGSRRHGQGNHHNGHLHVWSQQCVTTR